MADTAVKGLLGSNLEPAPATRQDPWGGAIITYKTENSQEAVDENAESQPEVEENVDENTVETQEAKENSSETEQPSQEEPSDTSDTADESDTPEDEEGKPESEEEVTEGPNPYYYLGGQLKTDGFIPEDFELTEDVAGIEVYNAYKKGLESQLKPQITQQVYTELENQGINQNDLVVARALREGVDVDLLSEATMHERYASTSSEAPEPEKVNAIRSMYKSRGFSEKEIENQIKIAKQPIESEDDDNPTSLLEEYFAEAKKFHKSKWELFREDEQKRVTTREREEHLQLEAAENLVKKVLSEKVVYGEALSEEESVTIRDAIYTSSDMLDWQGQQYSVSKLYKFNYLLNSDPELKLWLFKKYLFKDTDSESIKSEVEKKMESDMLKAYEASVKKDLNSRRNKEITQKLEENRVEVIDEDTGKNTYYVELGA